MVNHNWYNKLHQVPVWWILSHTSCLTVYMVAPPKKNWNNKDDKLHRSDWDSVRRRSKISWDPKATFANCQSKRKLPTTFNGNPMSKPICEKTTSNSSPSSISPKKYKLMFYKNGKKRARKRSRTKHLTLNHLWNHSHKGQKTSAHLMNMLLEFIRMNTKSNGRKCHVQ